MRVVIAGGSGFIGSALTRALMDRGDEVIILSRSQRKNASQNERLHHEQWDGQRADQLALAIQDADAVINLVGENIAAGRWTPARKQAIVESRVRAGTALTQAVSLLQKRPSVVIQGSATGWYGAWPDMQQAPLCTESLPSGHGFLAATVMRWEASTAEINAPDVRRCVIRTAPVLDGHGGMLARILPLFRLGLGGPLGSGQQPFPWIHLHDEISAILFLLDHPECAGAFNLSAPEQVDNHTFTALLGQALHRPVILPAPAFALRLAFGEMANELLLAGQRAVPERLLAAGFRFQHASLASALSTIKSN